MNNICIFGAAIAVGVGAATEASAHEAPDSAAAHDPYRHLREVVVKGSQRSSLAPSQVISRDQIIALPSSSVADALKYMTGVQIKDYGGLGGQKTINVRSMGSQHVGVYIDGVRVTNAQNGTVDLGKYSLSTLESVSLFNANKNESLMTASEYASASTVYLKTHRPDSTALTAGATIGSFSTYKGSLTWMYRSNPKAGRKALAGFVDAAYTYSKGDYPFRYHTQYEDTTGRRRNSDIRMVRAQACLFWQGLQLHAYFYDSERGLPGGIVRRLSDTYTDVGREWDRNFFTQATYTKQWDRTGLRAIMKYSDDHLHYRSDYPENISVHANNKYHQQDIYSAMAGSYRQPLPGEWGEVKLSASTDLRWSDLNCDVKNFAYVYRLDSKTSLSAIYTRRGLTASASGLYTHVSDHTRGHTKPLSRVTYNALLSYSLRHSDSEMLSGLQLRAFYKSVFRVPTLNDLYYTLVGNRNLKPEYTKQYDLGMAYTLPTTRWTLDIQLDGYYNRVEDRIVCLPLKGSYQWTMLNYGYTRCLGVNLTANAGYKAHHLLLSATFQDDRDLTDPAEESYYDFIAYSPQWSMTAVYTGCYRDFTLSLSHMYVGKRYWTAENSIEAPLSAYHCTDIKVSYKWRMYTLEAECQNLFDTQYEMIQRWPMPGRRYTFTLRVNV